MHEDMSFVEGTYRLDSSVWRVFTCFRARGHWSVGVKHVSWNSGVAGVNVAVADDAILNKQVVLQALSDALGVTQWSEVQGPDSMVLR